MNAGRKQQGFTYLGILILVAVMGAGLAAFGTIASHAAQREKEAELLFRCATYASCMKTRSPAAPNGVWSKDRAAR